MRDCQTHMRLKVKFLVVVWGETYIERFAALSLSSYFAPGNLPALAHTTELEVVIMTRRDDIGHFEKLAAFRHLRSICPVRFVEIDDLVATSVYGVTLTLAYARPVIACGREMLDTHFIFMNADFVLADGSLHSLCKHIIAGRSIVLGPSFRATAEAVEPLLEAALEKSAGILTIPPRQLVALSLAHPHPTTVAKILNQGFCHSTHPNQFFWQIDDRTMLGRYYLIFMLCLKPERIIEKVNCFCDYAFIPEMCPSGDEAVMNDSDDFFMLELQKRDQEMHLLRIGQASEKEIARSLGEWTTVEHRRAAGYDIVFHAERIPAGIETAKDKARAFVHRVGKRLGHPIPHATHKYWIRGIVAWQAYRKALTLHGSPPELATLPVGFRTYGLRWFWSSVYAGRRMLRRIKTTPFHPSWLDYRLLRDAIANILSTPGARVLMVRDKPDMVDSFVGGADVRVRFATVQDTLNGGPPSPKGRSSGYTGVLIYLLRKDCRSAQELINRCRPAMDSRGTCQVFIQHALGETESGNFSHELVRHVEDILGRPEGEAACLFVGGSLKRLNSRIFSRLSRHYARFGMWAIPWILPLLMLALLFALMANLYLSLKLPSSRRVEHCSSVAIQFNLCRDIPSAK
jgi:hypothetical protein